MEPSMLERLEWRYPSMITPCNDNVINIYHKKNNASFRLSVEGWVITLAHFQHKFLNNRSKLAKSSMGTFLQTLQRFLHVTDLPILSLSNKIRWLLYVYFFLEITMKNYILNVQLVQGPILRSNYGYKWMNRSQFSHWRESIWIMYFISLWISIAFSS